MVKAQITDLISGPIIFIDEHENKGRYAGEGPSEVPGSREISKEENQGGLHSLKQEKNQGTDGRED